MRFDYVSVGFYTFDCLGWPVSDIPPGGGTLFIDEITLAVSGVAGTAAIVVAKLGLKTLAVGGYGCDMMGDWAVSRLADCGIDTSGLQRLPGVPTSSSIVLTRRDGSRPALHVKAATGHFVVPPAEFDRITDTRVFHMGGVGLMDAMDGPRIAALMAHTKARGCITTVDVFAGSAGDLPDVDAVLPHTDYFIPSVEEAQALTDLDELAAVLSGPQRRSLRLHPRVGWGLLPRPHRLDLPHPGVCRRRALHLRLRRRVQRGLCGGSDERHVTAGLGAPRAGLFDAECHGPRPSGRGGVAARNAGVHADLCGAGRVNSGTGPIRRQAPACSLAANLSRCRHQRGLGRAQHGGAA